MVKHTAVLGKRKTKHACVVDADESTRQRLEEAGHKPHQDHISAKEMNCFTHCSLVHKFIPMPKALKIPDAKAAMENNWGKLKKIPAWAAKYSLRHWWISVTLWTRRWNPQYQKYKGRVVLRGDSVKEDPGSYAVFAEQGSSASQTTAAKVMDIISRLPGCTRQAADTVSAYTQVKMEDPLTFLKLPMFESENCQKREPQGNLTPTLSLDGPMTWKVMQRNVWTDIANFRIEKLNNYLKSQRHAWMIISLKKKIDQLENINCLLTYCYEMSKLARIGRLWYFVVCEQTCSRGNEMDKSLWQKFSTSDLVRSSHMNTGNIVMWETTLQIRIVARLWFWRRPWRLDVNIKRNSVYFRKSHVRAKKLDVQETDLGIDHAVQLCTCCICGCTVHTSRRLAGGFSPGNRNLS